MDEEKNTLKSLAQAANSVGFKALIAGAIVLVVAMITSYTIVRLQKKTKKLQNKLDRANEEKAQAVEEVSLINNETYRMIAQANLEHWKEESGNLASSLVDIAESQNRAVTKLQNIKDWKDISIVDKRSSK